jgi:hypothetical protein
MRGNEKCREASLFRAEGVVKHDETRIPRHFGKSTTPSAPSEVASPYFLDVASTPPHEERIIRVIRTASLIQQRTFFHCAVQPPSIRISVPVMYCLRRRFF